MKQTITMSSEDDPDCGFGIGEHTFILNIINVSVLWFIVPFVLNIKRPYVILEATAWSTLKVSQPGAVADVSIRARRNVFACTTTARRRMEPQK